MTTTESPAAWLAALAPGDEVVVTSVGGKRERVRVTRLTETRIFVRTWYGEQWFSRQDGRSQNTVGFVFTTYIEPILPSPRALVEVPRG